MNHHEFLYRTVMRNGGTIGIDRLRRLSGMSQQHFSTILSKLGNRQGLTVTRLDKHMDPVDEDLSGPKKGHLTQYIRIESDQVPSFNKSKNGHLPPSVVEAIQQSTVSQRSDEYLAPCMRPLKSQEHPDGVHKCYHGQHCANGYKCPVAVNIRRIRKYEDTRIEARKRLRSRGYKTPWAFTIRDAFDRVSLKSN